METRLTRPIARSKGLVVEELGDELLVYDLEVKHAHCLTPLAARVWRESDGRTRVEEIAEKLGVEVSEVNEAVKQLNTCDLLDNVKLKGGLTRRDLGVKLTKVAAASATLPLILSIAAPAAAASASEQQFCFAQTPVVDPDNPNVVGTNNCNICNEQTGANTLCCCCHAPTRNVNPTVKSGLKSCAADARQCCCPPTTDEPFNWGKGTGSNAPHHCTEPDGSQQLCDSFIAANGCA